MSSILTEYATDAFLFNNWAAQQASLADYCYKSKYNRIP